MSTELTDQREEWLRQRREDINAMSNAMLDALEGTYEEAKLLQESAFAAQNDAVNP